MLQKVIGAFYRYLRQFFVFYLVKLKVTFRNTIFWCWIWGLIHTNHFYNFQLIELKTNIQCTNMHFNNIQDFGAFFSNNIYNLQPWSKLVETKFENPVSSRNRFVFQIPNSCPYLSPVLMLNLVKYWP